MDQTLVKQELLKNEIFEKGYDIDNFTTYLDSLKANGTVLHVMARWQRYRGVVSRGAVASCCVVPNREQAIVRGGC
jgi:hypothetical protein